jgi:hypothetical protein
VSAPVRFLVLVVAGWAGIRAMTLGAVPGFTVSYAKEMPASGRLPPIVATQFPALPPVEAAAFEQQPFAYPPTGRIPVMPATYYAPYGYAYSAAAAPQSIPERPQWSLPPTRGLPASSFLAAADGTWEVASLAAFPERQSRPAPVLAAPPPAEPRLDRVQMTSWALLRGAPSPGALATGGTLGGSQAGARLTYAFNRWIAASLRTTSPVGGARGAEVAGGVRVTPLRSVPVAFTIERRQSISPHGGGRSAFAVFAEGGLYRQPMPWKFTLDAYVQGGLVGLKSRDYFVDGAFSFTRPIWGRVSAGFGLWGGAQPGIYRVDAGPRLSVRVRDNIYAHVDWRQRIAGTAQPSSGRALTLAAVF